MNNNKETNILLYIGISLCISVLFLFINGSRVGGVIRDGISYVYTPVSVVSMKMGKDSKEFLSFFTNISRFQSEYQALKIENLELRIFKDSVNSLVEENNLLKKQLKLGSKENKIILSDIVGYNQSGTIGYINIGSENGIQSGNPVVIGNVLVGFVQNVDLKSSSVIFLNNSEVFIKSRIIKKISTESNLKEILTQISSTKTNNILVSGREGYVSVENIPVGSTKNGDIVITNEPSIGNNYIIGKIKDLEGDLAVSTQKAKLEIAINPQELQYLFVIIK